MGEPGRYELARLSYSECLDATKHQDDKIGRLLGAVAFLTGGALVFVGGDVLRASYDLGGRDYQLPALFLGVFLVVDLAAVVVWLFTVSTPLTVPAGSNPSYLFFRVIARDNRSTWTDRWKEPLLADKVTENLISESHNLARRAFRKSERSRIAALAFLAAVVALVPTLTLGIDAAARFDGTSLAWDARARIIVALPLALGALLVGLCGRVPEREPRPRSRPALAASVAVLAFLSVWFIGSGDRLWLQAGALAVLGVVVVGLTWSVTGGWRATATASAFVAATAALFSLLADRPEWQVAAALLAAWSPLVEHLRIERPAA